MKCQRLNLGTFYEKSGKCFCVPEKDVEGTVDDKIKGIKYTSKKVCCFYFTEHKDYK